MARGTLVVSGERDFSSRRHGRRAGAGRLWLAAGLVVVGVSAYQAWSTWRDLVHTREAVAEAAREARELDDRLRRFEKERGVSGESLASRVLLNDVAPPSRVLAEIDRVMPADVRLTGVSVEYDKKVAIEMRVSARTARDYDELLRRLSVSPAFVDVAPGAESREGVVDATVRANLRLGEEPTP